ncbi:MAG: S24 family peptidase [Balneolaceae bacterium]
MLAQSYQPHSSQTLTLKKRRSAETGFSCPAAGHMEGQLNLHEYLVQRPASTFFSRVKGNSDNNLGVFDGDILVVDRSLAPRHESLVVAVVEGEFRICRLIQEKQWMLEYGSGKRITIDFEEEQRSVIWGRVSHVIHSCI